MDYKRLTKPIARKMYGCGYEIKLLPCKVNSTIALDSTAQGHFWINPVPVKKDSPDHIIQYEDKSIRQCDSYFDRVVRAFEFYNCNSELGYYPHYFVTQEDYDEWCVKYQFKKEDK